MTTCPRQLDTFIVRVEHRLGVTEAASLLTEWWNGQPASTPHPRPGQVREIAARTLHQRATRGVGISCPPAAWALRVATKALLNAHTRPQRSDQRSQDSQAGRVRSDDHQPRTASAQANNAVTCETTR